jgi:hypothetical protein
VEPVSFGVDLTNGTGQGTEIGGQDGRRDAKRSGGASVDRSHTGSLFAVGFIYVHGATF